jgi:molybdopterin-containing oxidoreductase family iron-sulfur binding subunit
MAASTALAASVSCSRNIDRSRSVPYTRKPEDVVPGVADLYATAFQEGEFAYGVLAKVREGKPIHIEGNDLDPLHGGKAPLRAVADLLSLYDPDRIRKPLLDGKLVEWDAANARVVQALRDAKDRGKEILLMTQAMISPTRRALITELKKVLPRLRHIEWEPAADPMGYWTSRTIFGDPIRADYRFDRARVIVSLEADFLGTWGDTTRAAALFAKNRKMPADGRPMSRLYVFEGGMSLTGSNADCRVPAMPSVVTMIPFVLARLLHEKHGLAYPKGFDPNWLEPFEPGAFAANSKLPGAILEALATELAIAGSESLVLVGSQLLLSAHAGCHLLNLMLGTTGTTVDAASGLEWRAIAPDPSTGALDGYFEKQACPIAVLWDIDPLMDFGSERFWKLCLDYLPERVFLGRTPNGTAQRCTAVLPINHWLESWGDLEAARGTLYLQQPACQPMLGTRQAEDILLAWAKDLGAPDLPSNYLEFMKSKWEKEIYAPGAVPFETFWNACLHDGVHSIPGGKAVTSPRVEGFERTCRDAFESSPIPPGDPNSFLVAGKSFEILLRPSHQVYDGRYANNGWLQELPDPITKSAWGNPCQISKADAELLKVRDGELISVKTSLGGTWSGPVLIQQGQAQGTLVLTLGYGRNEGSVAGGIGTNPRELAGTGLSTSWNAEASKIPGSRLLYRTQMHHSLDGRKLVEWGTPSEFQGKNPKKHPELASLYPEFKYKEHRWGMSIDLAACIGCAGCSVACQSENNIPVVGPEQVQRGREMQWIRIDRYYEGPPENPVVLHQPMLCQHCGSAPCENVCPVNATNHSPEGINQMAYNRCVGTRYCANNCPYKVRRFNFFDYTQSLKAPMDLAMNPEVSIRPRGVMEKCTFCVQRIQDAKQVAKAAGRPLTDRDVRPACAAACPTDAIVFGDLKDPESEVSRRAEDPRGFKVLEELGAQPAITYLARLRNPSEEKE